MPAIAVPASTSYTPGQQGCATLISQIRAFLQAPDDSEVKSVALAGMNSGIAKINSRVWRKLYGTTDISTVAGTLEYGVPADFKEPIRLLALDSSDNRQERIEFLTNDEFYEAFSTAETGGSPDYYTYNYSTRKLELNVAPSSGFYPTMRLRYHKRFPKLTCTGTTGLPPEFDEFLVARGASWLAIVRDPKKVRDLKIEAGERWHELVRDDMENRTDYR